MQIQLSLIYKLTSDYNYRGCVDTCQLIFNWKDAITLMYVFPLVLY